VPSSIWTGAISFGLVSIPVRLYPATESKSVRFNLLHKKDGSRVKERYYWPTRPSGSSGPTPSGSP
jgi:DNA end-binding protein Ku